MIIKGTKGDDVLIGTPGRDIIKGRGGDDVIFGKAGHDEIWGGPGDDDIYSGKGSDRIAVTSGFDTIHWEWHSAFDSIYVDVPQEDPVIGYTTDYDISTGIFYVNSEPTVQLSPPPTVYGYYFFEY